MNDNDQSARNPQSAPDPYGHAALLLVESLLHELVGKTVLTLTEAVTIVENAAEVKSDIAPDFDDSSEMLEKSVNLLEAIAASLRIDLTIKG